jgi:hypothetical protein
VKQSRQFRPVLARQNRFAGISTKPDTMCWQRSWRHA